MIDQDTLGAYADWLHTQDHPHSEMIKPMEERVENYRMVPKVVRDLVGGTMKRVLATSMLSVLLLAGCSMIPSSNPAKEPTAVVNGNSQFTPEGIKDMTSSRRASFDVSSRPLTMAALGVAEGSDGTLVATDTNEKIAVSVKTPRGVVEMHTDTLRIRPGGLDGLVDHIDICYNFPDAQDANPEIERAANQLGFRFLDDVAPIGPEFKDGSGKQSWNPGLGNSTGTVFSVEAMENHTTGSLTWIYSIQLADKYYSPEATASIAATGVYTRS